MIKNDTTRADSASSRTRGRLTRAIIRRPFRDESGHKGWLQKSSRAQKYVIRHIHIAIPRWPNWSRPLRAVFLSDFHTGSHSNDVERLSLIIDEAAAYRPDLALFGGDYVNLQLLGGGRVPPRTTAAILSRLETPLGRFAVLGNHDYVYDQYEVANALEDHAITVLDHSSRAVRFQDGAINVLGIPDAHVMRPEAYSVLRGLCPERPTIVLSHDPVWFGFLPTGPYLMLAGHTHGGQVRFPGIGVIRNSSKAPLRWSYGLVNEKEQHLYVTSGIGTSGIPFRWRVPPEFVVLDLRGP